MGKGDAYRVDQGGLCAGKADEPPASYRWRATAFALKLGHNPTRMCSWRQSSTTEASRRSIEMSVRTPGFGGTTPWWQKLPIKHNSSATSRTPL